MTKGTAKSTQANNSTSKESNLVRHSETNPSEKAAIPHTFESMLGSISWLMLQSPQHRHLFLSDFEWLILPALMSKQFRIIKQNNMPIAYISWAFIDEATETRIAGSQKMAKLAPHEWRSGDRPWIIDLIAPFGGAKEILQKIQETEFKDKSAKVFRIRKDGKGIEGVSLNDAIAGDKTEDETPSRQVS